MVDFVHPFPGRNPGDLLTKVEIIRALRLAICAEQEAVQLYDLIAEYVKDETIAKIMIDVADEEQVHIGEFQKLLDIYEFDEEEKIEEGKNEVEEKINSKQSKEVSENEIEQILRTLVGRGEQHLCEITQFSKEWDALEYALKQYKREHGIKALTNKKGLYQNDAIKIVEQFLEDPRNQCDLNNLREAIGKIWEFMEKRVYGKSIVSSLRTLIDNLK